MRGKNRQRYELCLRCAIMYWQKWRTPDDGHYADIMYGGKVGIVTRAIVNKKRWTNLMQLNGNKLCDFCRFVIPHAMVGGKDFNKFFKRH